MKKLVAVINMILMMIVAFSSVRQFNNALTTGESLKGLFWMIVSIAAFLGFLEDYRKDKWPF